MKATFGTGCFWNTQYEFDKLKVKTKVGFMGGSLKNLSYSDVSSGRTGHAEVCQVEYDPDVITYDKLLKTFWKIHDPTQMNKQGPDIGSQYRSVIFYHTKEQKELALKSLEREQKKYDKVIVTAIEKASKFYLAEEYHQKYSEKHNVKGCGY